ncbi:hypothetical protein [Bacillus alveayuensis]|jgi:hypothetical protein|uniref:hypothetical protein n=1 Tax=Aeribacillus alveayuensis TaxID=279215 RepID=UPI0005D0FC71|nr:hypothetical protein [Bacillus alveayuensis]
MIKNLDSLILSNNFEDGKRLVESIDFKTFSEEILYNAYNNCSIIYYSFLNYLLIENETSKIHDLAFSLLVNPLSHLEGAYNSALYHALRSVELTNRKDVGSLENLLFLNTIPDKLISDEEAIKICKEILKLDNKNELAKESLNELLQN